MGAPRCCRALGMGQDGLSPHQLITPEGGRGLGGTVGQSCQPPMESLGAGGSGLGQLGDRKGG